MTMTALPTPASALAQAMAQLPLVAILRGLTHAEAPAIGDALVSSGFALIEVPLNSPEPLQSIATLAARYPQALVGAGTVLHARQVQEVHAVGGRLIVAPNFNPAVVAQAVSLGMVVLPGVATPSEAFAALDAGAHGLKLFPAEMISPGVVKALRAVLPASVPLLTVGGIGPDNMGAYKKAGASGFGIGSSLYKPGQSAAQTLAAAHHFIQHWKSLT